MEEADAGAKFFYRASISSFVHAARWPNKADSSAAIHMHAASVLFKARPELRLNHA
jgi:hypothetical protein